jgi:hypothetical protein
MEMSFSIEATLLENQPLIKAFLVEICSPD